MTEPPNMDDLHSAISQVEGMMKLIEATAPVRELTSAYREQLVNDDFPADVAAQMAVEFHAMVMDMFRRKLAEHQSSQGGNRAARRARR